MKKKFQIPEPGLVGSKSFLYIRNIVQTPSQLCWLLYLITSGLHARVSCICCMCSIKFKQENCLGIGEHVCCLIHLVVIVIMICINFLKNPIIETQLPICITTSQRHTCFDTSNHAYNAWKLFAGQNITSLMVDIVKKA